MGAVTVLVLASACAVSGLLAAPLHNVDLLNLNLFVKLVGSLDPSQASVAYMNGTVYARQPGSTLRTLLLYEGFNIGHQVPQRGGNFLSETREVVFYRDPIGGEIVHVWQNPYSSLPNEVFPVTNDPVNSNLTTAFPIPQFNFPDGTLCVPLDFVLQYPNPLDPKRYPLYSAGPNYEAVELFQYHGNTTDIISPTIKSVSNSITWTRMSQWLPWMEMGKTPGKLFYTAFSWKLQNGIQDLPKEILHLVSSKYPKFLKPPQTYEKPNESSWVSFKKIIDARRAKGEPDILLPPQNITSLPSLQPFVDPALLQAVLTQSSLSVAWKGDLLPDIVNRTALPLLVFSGQATGRVSMVKGGYRVTGKVFGSFQDPVTGQYLQTWLNPITQKNVKVPKFKFSGSHLFETEFVTSMAIAPRDEIGLTAVTSHTDGREDGEVWLADMFEFLVKKQSLSSISKPYFYGTWMRYSNWFPWMQMDDIPGTLICRLHMYQNDLS